jgi:hypothetical protein
LKPVELTGRQSWHHLLMRRPRELRKRNAHPGMHEIKRNAHPGMHEIKRNAHPGMHEIKRNAHPGMHEIEFFLVRAPTDSPVSAMIRAARLRRKIEQGNQTGKDRLGLDHYQVRKHSPGAHVTSRYSP